MAKEIGVEGGTWGPLSCPVWELIFAEISAMTLPIMWPETSVAIPLDRVQVRAGQTWSSSCCRSILIPSTYKVEGYYNLFANWRGVYI